MSQEDRFGTSEPKKTREQIENEIAQTRSALSDDLAALGEKLSPEHLKEGAKGVMDEVRHAAKDSIREAKDAAVGTLRDAATAATSSLREAKDHAFEAVTETAHEIGIRAQRVGHVTGSFVTTHAVPLTLIGLGMGWLMLSLNHSKRREQQRYLYEGGYDREYDYLTPRGSFSSETGYYGEQRTGMSGARGLAQTARDRVGQMTDRAAHAIDDTRGQLRETVDAARSRVGGAVQTARSRVGETVDTARSRVGETVDAARSRVGETVDAARARMDGLRTQASEMGHDVGVRASEMSHQAYAQLQRAGTRTREFTDENPLAVGALAVVAGVSVGLLLPSTRRENQLLGEARDRILSEARHAASRVGEGVQRTAGELRGALTEQSPQR